MGRVKRLTQLFEQANELHTHHAHYCSRVASRLLQVVLDPDTDQHIGNGNAWDIYAQQSEKCGVINYWAVCTGNDKHVAHMDIPKWSKFIHFSPCADRFITIDISGKEKCDRCDVTIWSFDEDITDLTKLGSINVIPP